MIAFTERALKEYNRSRHFLRTYNLLKPHLYKMEEHFWKVADILAISGGWKEVNDMSKIDKIFKVKIRYVKKAFKLLTTILERFQEHYPKRLESVRPSAISVFYYRIKDYLLQIKKGDWETMREIYKELGLGSADVKQIIEECVKRGEIEESEEKRSTSKIIRWIT
ncbi:MAG: hypothetical protein ACTSR3_07750 [Candidatus Helarchaeota archaeon]